MNRQIPLPIRCQSRFDAQKFRCQPTASVAAKVLMLRDFLLSIG
jgi:hypothetical protein